MNWLFLGMWVTVLSYMLGWSGQLLHSYSPSFWTHSSNKILSVSVLLHGILVFSFLMAHSSDTTMFPPLVLSGVSWLVMCFYLLIKNKILVYALRGVIPPFAVLLLLISFYLIDPLTTEMPNDDSVIAHQFILIVHIITIVAGHILFGVACVSSILFLYQERQLKTKLITVLTKRFPSLATLDQISYRSIIFGFLFLTIGLILGVSLRRVSADPNHVIGLRLLFALVVWMMYAIFLIERFSNGSHGRFTAMCSIMGFCLMFISMIIETITLL